MAIAGSNIPASEVILLMAELHCLLRSMPNIKTQPHNYESLNQSTSIPQVRTAMKKLKINWQDLETAFESQSGEFGLGDEVSNYFDKETGQVFDIDESISELMTAIFKELDEAGIKESGWTEQEIRGTDSFAALMEWAKPGVLAAIQMECGGDLDRYELVPSFESHDGFTWMQDFIETVNDEVVKKKLASALTKRKPFRNFRDAMGSDRRLQQQWRVFEAACQRELVTEWLQSIGVEPLNADELTYNPPPLPELRKIMFAEVRRFVRFARDISGVQRIALIGSLASDKEFPKDIDMLVTIADDCDLTQLARLGRELAGHMAAHTSGADVFLSSSSGEYLGRTCSWKKCAPGVRASCDAQSCGRRHYLHDDFESIRLSEKIVQHPPVILWPEITLAPKTPADVHELLITPLKEDRNR